MIRKLLRPALWSAGTMTVIALAAVSPFVVPSLLQRMAVRQGHGLWGVVFFRSERIVSVKKFTGRVRYEGQDGLASCLAHDQNPAFFAVAPDTLSLRSTAK